MRVPLWQDPSVEDFWDGFAGDVAGSLVAFVAAIVVLLASRRHGFAQARRDRSVVVATEMYRELTMFVRSTSNLMLYGTVDVERTRALPERCEALSAFLDARILQLDDRLVVEVLTRVSEGLYVNWPIDLRRAVARSDPRLVDLVQEVVDGTDDASEALRIYLQTPGMKDAYAIPWWRRWTWDREKKRLRRRTGLREWIEAVPRQSQEDIMAALHDRDRSLLERWRIRRRRARAKQAVPTLDGATTPHGEA